VWKLPPFVIVPLNVTSHNVEQTPKSIDISLANAAVGKASAKGANNNIRLILIPPAGHFLASISM
jgi:hypothetical protein